MNARFITALLGISLSVASIGTPVFNVMNDCPSIKTAIDEGRRYLDFGGDVRLRLTPDMNEGEIALRGESAFDTHESIYRPLESNRAITLRAIDSASDKAVVEVYAKGTGSELEYVAVYHRTHSAIVVSSFDGGEPVCEKLANSSATDFIADLSRSTDSKEGELRFISSQQVYQQLGLD